MSKFKDFEELVEPLVLPIGGTLYRIPPVNAEDGIRFRLARDSDSETPQLTDAEFFEIFLGDAYEQMLADNIPDTAITRAAQTAHADFERGRSVAEVMWETGADPKALLDFVQANTPKRKSQSGAQKKRTAKATKTH